MILEGCTTQPSISRTSFHQRPSHFEVLELAPGVGDRPLRRVLHNNAHELTPENLAPAESWHPLALLPMRG